MNTTTRPTGRVLPDTSKPALPSAEQLMAMIAELQAQNAALAAQAKSAKRAIGFKVSEKGCLTMTGLGQWGATYYASQWATILDNAPAIAAALRDNLPHLTLGKPGWTPAQIEAQRATVLASIQTYLD